MTVSLFLRNEMCFVNMFDSSFAFFCSFWHFDMSFLFEIVSVST